MQHDFQSLAEMTKVIPNEEAAIEYFTAIRWKNGAFCPRCGCKDVYHFGDKKDHKCKTCRRRFSIKVGTVMEGTKIGVRQWLMTIWIITSHKKGIASTQLARDLGVTQKTAWFMLHRLRHAARTRSFNRQLKGTIEADESFFGGKEKNKHAHKRGLKRKAVAFGMLERNGELRVAPVEHQREGTGEIMAQVERGSRLMTDDYPGYTGLWRNYEHERVIHSKGEYVRDGYIHINSLEGYWSQLKRQIYGIHHWVSHKHLGRYIDENAWRYNRRDVGEAPRMNEFIGRLDGRITYPALIA